MGNFNVWGLKELTLFEFSTETMICVTLMVLVLPVLESYMDNFQVAFMIIDTLNKVSIKC